MYYNINDMKNSNQITNEYLAQLFEINSIKNGKSIQKILELGGVKVLAGKLNSNLEKGLSHDDITKSRSTFGSNTTSINKQSTLWNGIVDSLQDFSTQFLIILVIISAILHIFSEDPLRGFIEGGKLIGFIVAKILFEAASNYMAQKPLELMKQQREYRACKVKRQNEITTISTNELVVGDILMFQQGTIVTIDGLLLKGEKIIMDESSITGEIRPSQKLTFAEVASEIETSKSVSQNPFLISGTKCQNGVGEMIVLAVGKNTVTGKINFCQINEEDESTPLSLKLFEVTQIIGYFGIIVSLLAFAILIGYLGIDCYQGRHGFLSLKTLQVLLESLQILATIMIVSIPDGLPCLATLSFAYSLEAMKDEQCFVLNLRQAEQAGCMDEICIDSSILTENEQELFNGTLIPDVAMYLREISRLGVNIRMVTKYNKEISSVIASKCGVLSFTKEGGKYEIVEGEFFREFVGRMRTGIRNGRQIQEVGNMQNFETVCQDLKVLVNTTDQDIAILVTGLKDQGHTVGMVGDQSPNASILKKSDISFVEEQTQSDIAKQTAGFIMQNNNLGSVITAIKWGRNIQKSIRKQIEFKFQGILAFLIIQSIVILLFKIPIFDVIQMLWINLIIDVISSQAFAAEQNGDLILKPYQENSVLLTNSTQKNIAFGVLYQISTMFVILFVQQIFFQQTNKTSFCMCFQTFVLILIFNQIYFKLSDINLSKAFKLKIFWQTQLLTLIVQFLFINFGEQIMKIVSLTLQQHLICFCLGIGIILFQIAGEKILGKKEGKLKE